MLRDYAQLAADEFVRRGTSTIGYRGYYRLLGGLTQIDAAGALPERQTLVAADEAIEPVLALAHYFFRYDSASGQLETAAGPPPPPAVATWLKSRLGAAEPSGERRPMTALHTEIEGAPRSFIYTFSGEPPQAIGFEVERESLGPWFEQALARRPLLPPSLGDGGSEAGDLRVTVRDARGREVFRSEATGAGSPDPYALTASAPFADAYEGILDGMTVKATLDPEAADRLVIGGLPGSRLPLLLGLLALTAGLLASVAIVRLRRAPSARSICRGRRAPSSRPCLPRAAHAADSDPADARRDPAAQEGIRSARSEERRKVYGERGCSRACRLGRLVENVLEISRLERARRASD